jgi:hypothetical protein
MSVVRKGRKFCLPSRADAVGLVLIVSYLLADAFASQSLLYPALLTGFQVEGMLLDLLDDVFLLDLALETSQRVFQRFSILQSYFCQTGKHLISV